MELYNIEDYEYCSYLKSLCLAGLPIPFYNKVLHHIKVKDIFEMGETNYSTLINPFRLNPKIMFKSVNGGEKIFLLDILTADDFEASIQLNYCIEFLKLIFITENINLTDFPNDDSKGVHKEIVIDNDLWLDKHKFEQLSQIILKMCYLRRITEEDRSDGKKEKKLTYEQIMSIKDRRERAYQLAIYNKNKKEEDNQKKALSLYSIFNYVCHASGVIDYEKPLGFNLYQFYNTYLILNKSEKYESDMGLLSSGMVSDIKKIDTRWFSERIVDDE